MTTKGENEENKQQDNIPRGSERGLNMLEKQVQNPKPVTYNFKMN